MIHFARIEHQAESGSPLTMSWMEQLLEEAETAVRLADTPEHFARTVWELAKLTYGRVQGIHLIDLWSVDEDMIVQKLSEHLAISDECFVRLRALSRAEEEAAAVQGTYPGVPSVRELRRLAVRLIQCARDTKRADTVIQ